MGGLIIFLELEIRLSLYLEISWAKSKDNGFLKSDTLAPFALIQQHLVFPPPSFSLWFCMIFITKNQSSAQVVHKNGQSKQWPGMMGRVMDLTLTTVLGSCFWKQTCLFVFVFIFFLFKYFSDDQTYGKLELYMGLSVCDTAFGLH